jgi:hypothetical protein
MTEDSAWRGKDDVESIEDLTNSRFTRDRDGVGSLRDTQEESGDENEVADLYDLDRREARDLGVLFDSADSDEPSLD